MQDPWVLLSCSPAEGSMSLNLSKSCEWKQI